MVIYFSTHVTSNFKIMSAFCCFLLLSVASHLYHFRFLSVKKTCGILFNKRSALKVVFYHNYQFFFRINSQNFRIFPPKNVCLFFAFLIYENAKKCKIFWRTFFSQKMWHLREIIYPFRWKLYFQLLKRSHMLLLNENNGIKS